MDGGSGVLPLVDRDREIDEIRRFHARRHFGSAALLIRGEPGSGRTALLDAASAADDDTLVLRARPQPEETTQPLAALRDMVGPRYSDVADQLHPPLRTTLAAALLREADPQAEAGLLPPALAASLVILAAQRPVLLAIDDVEWLDPDSLRGLRFAINRLPSRISIAVVHGDAIDPVLLLGIDRSVPPAHISRVVAHPLTVAGVHDLLTRSLGAMPRRLVNRIAMASGGNPRAALELARAALRAMPLTNSASSRRR